MSNHLPISRIKTIMKSSADVETISKESLQLVTAAAELFIQHLAKRAEKQAAGKQIDYKHLAEVVNTSERYDFLTEIIPRKVTVRQFKKMLRDKNENRSSSEDSNSDDSDSEDSSSDSDDSSTSTDDKSDQNEGKVNGPSTETTNAPSTETTNGPSTETTNCPSTETINGPSTEKTNGPSAEKTTDKKSVE